MDDGSRETGPDGASILAPVQRPSGDPGPAAPLLKSMGLRPRKALGQHFLAAPGIVRRIVEAADLAGDDAVVEVGPGLGALTHALADRAGSVTALEADPSLVLALERAFAERPTVRIVHADALAADLEDVVPADGPYKVVANLPYYAATPIVRRFLEARHKPTLLVVMVQREVARGMAAAPGRTGLLGVAVQFYGRPRIVGYVRPGSFYPPPKVTSAIVRIDVHETPPVRVRSEAAFFALVRAGFAAPRKQLRGGLSHALGAPPAETERALRQAGIEPSRRAETVTISEWAALLQQADEAGWPL